jgi:nucleotide-binding universal stress UspA family protein
VVDLEATTTVRGRDTQRDTQARLDALARDVVPMTSAPVDTVVLFGEPAHALQQHAAEHGYELIVAGGGDARRSRGRAPRRAEARDPARRARPRRAGLDRSPVMPRRARARNVAAGQLVTAS